MRDSLYFYETVTPQKTIGDNLNYSFNYVYDKNYAHRLLSAGDRYYQYDSNGNVTCEQDGSFEKGNEVCHEITEEAEGVYSSDYAWAYFRDSNKTGSGSSRYHRTYTWDEKNRLINSTDSSCNTSYVYGQDGERTNKYTQSSETLYFNKMWTYRTDSGNSVYGGQTAKNIYLGETRIVTKLNSGTTPTYQEEYYKQYYYHSDHLGSASLISDYKGDEYQRIEYTPYGELWVEKTQNTGLEFLPYKFTAKEMDEETGLYYYGARYLDSRYSRWISTDPALGDYIPQAPVSDEARRHNQNLPGMGGVFNHINSNLFAYAANNPVRYIDPDGRENELSENNINKINTLHPEIRESVIKMLKNLKEAGEIVEISLAYRSYDEQDKLYNKGRNDKGEVTDPSKVVTNAKGGQSYHNFGLAFDLTVYDKDGKKNWKKDSDSWKKVIDEGKKQGFDAGAEWTDFPDLPHFEKTFGLSQKKLREKKDKNDMTGEYVNVK